MDLIPIQILYDGKWKINEKDMWVYGGSKVKSTLIRKSSMLSDLKDAVYKALVLVPEQYELSMKFFIDWNVPNASPCPCTTDMEVAVFLDNQIRRLNSPIYKSPLFVDIVPQVRHFPILHRARTVNESFSSGSGSNHSPLSNTSPRDNNNQVPLPAVGLSATPFPIPEMQERETQVSEKQVLETEVPGTQLDEDPGDNFDNERLHDDFIERWASDDVADNPNKDNPYNDVSHCDDVPYDSPTANSVHGKSTEEINEEGDTRNGQTCSAVQSGDKMISATIPPMSYPPCVPHIPTPEPSSRLGKTIEKEQIYKSKQELQKKLSLYAIRKNFEFKVKKSDKGRYDIGCIDHNCPWKIHATKMSKSEFWMIKTYVTEHKCNLNIIHRDHRQASSSVVGEYIKSKFTRLGRQIRPTDIVEDVRKELGVNMSYEKAWRARESARASVLGTPEESYAKLPLWSAVLESFNPGSFTRIETDSEDRFKYYFMAIGACIRGFVHMRPVVAVDVIFLKNKYGGILYVAACLDGNEQIYPLAFGIGPSENDAAYLWFFSRFKEAYGNRSDLVFITDRHPNFSNAIQSVFPDAYHGYCTYHLMQNMKAKFKKTDNWKVIKNIFHLASRAYLMEDFDMYMGQLRDVHSQSAQYLMDANPSKWARSHFPDNRFSIMTINIAECMNTILRDARAEPIIPLISHIREILQIWFYERRNSAADHTNTPVTKWLDAILEKRREESTSLYVVPVTLHEFEVHDDDLIGKVNLQAKTCSCREFTLDGYPCIHAFAVCKDRNISPYSMCDSYYSVDVLRAGYSETIYPMGDPKQWHAPAEVLDRVVCPPRFTRKARPRMNLIPSQSEGRIIYKCGRCKRSGHNRKTCTFAIPLDSTIRGSD